jgi:hypothetical protein
MNKNELKKILKPLIKQCIKEVILEEGTLSTIISEVIKGTSAPRTIVAESAPRIPKQDLERKEKQLKEQRRKMLDAIGRDSYNGVDLFEGTTPSAPSRGSSGAPQGSRPMDGVDPRDPGIDISSFGSTDIWKKLAGK